MQTSNADLNYSFDDQAWYFLAEFSIWEFISDHDRRDELRAGLLFQAVRELGISPECVENIEMTLASFAQEAMANFKQGRLKLPARIRVFCQRKIIDDANSVHTALRTDPSVQAIEQAQSIHHSGAKMVGGWGYFLIERGGNVSTGSAVRLWNSVDLCLYKEGE